MIPHPCPLFSIFKSTLSNLWTLWELLIVGEPVLVKGDSPRHVSEVVLACKELIKPIPFGGDWRPYFTVMDGDYRRLYESNGGRSGSSAKSALGKSPPSSGLGSPHARSTSGTTPKATSKFGGISLTSSRGTLLGVTNPMFAGDGWNVLTVTSVPSGDDSEEIEISLCLKYKPILYKDKALIKQLTANNVFLSNASSRSSSPGKEMMDKVTPTLVILSELELENGARRRSLEREWSNLLRRRFGELTERFLQPFNRYFDTLLPTVVLLEDRGPSIKPWKTEVFLKNIEESGMSNHLLPQPASLTAFEFLDPSLPIPTRSLKPVTDLYKLFIHSPHFASWLTLRTTESTREWRRRWFDLFCDCELSSWCIGFSSKGEDVKVVDLWLWVCELCVCFLLLFSTLVAC